MTWVKLGNEFQVHHEHLNVTWQIIMIIMKVRDGRGDGKELKIIEAL